ncbi:MAG: DUF1330 domain-containing protein [Treponema sp.]|nr:DUF1330 domain-containing protein [Treponema sp.]
MSAYFIANIRIYKPDEFDKYLEKVDLVLKKFNGKYLCVDSNPERIEGKWDYSRLVLLEFQDKKSLKEWYNSKEYQEILKLRLSSAECDTIIVG